MIWIYTTNPMAFGGTDTKIADLNMLQKVSCIAQNGPTHDDLAAFSFSGEFETYPHYGMSRTFNYDWVYICGKRMRDNHHRRWYE